MRRAVLALMLSLAAAVPAAAGETVLTAPKPTMDQPRRILLQLTSDDPHRINGTLGNLGNLSKFYGMDNVQLAVVAYGPGVKALLKETSTVKDRIASLQDIDVEFVACGNTLSALGVPEDAVLPGVKVTEAGIAEIVERQRAGWHYIAP
ncbi:MAG: DsrE family protein [Actinomycetota bacterium]